MTTNKFPDWCQEWTDYMLANGFTEIKEFRKEPGKMGFSTLDRAILVCPSGLIKFFEYWDGDDDRADEWFEFSSFQGYACLDLMGFMMLMHITGTVPFKKFIAAAKKEFGSTDWFQEHVLQLSNTLNKVVAESPVHY